MMNRSRLGSLAVLLGIALTPAGCVNVDVGLASLRSADRAPRTAVLARGYAVQDLVIHRGDRLIGITHAHHPDSRAVIVFCGGDSFHRSIEGGEALETLARNADVMLFDYPGYGESTGSPTASVILENALAVYDYTVSLETSAGKKRVLYGFSVGGMVAAQIASRRAVDGLVLEATAPSAEAWARSQIPWYARPIVKPHIEPGLASIDALVALRHFGGNVLLLTSPADQRVPAALSVRMYRELHRLGVRTALVQFAGAEHGAIPHSPEYGAVLTAFLDHVEGPQ
jgi:pimeloyl-ACP methyl ester carboxylesterase